ncbi:MAG: alpha/beta fold hydrolase [Sphingomonadales bacterium]
MERIGEYLVFGGENRLTLILAHGAGAPMGSPFMGFMAKTISEAGFRVVLFNFDYMKRAVAEKRRLPPDRPEKLLAKWQQVIGEFQDVPLVLGGKSMGGRMASMLLSESPDLAKGLVCLGYPFHPPGRPEVLRVAHLEQVSCPALICQGERDALGNKAEIEKMSFPANFEFFWLPDGDHSLKPRVKSGFTEVENLTKAASKITEFLENLI